MNREEFDRALRAAEYHAEVVPVRYALTPEELHRVARFIFGKNWRRHPRVVKWQGVLKSL